MEIETVGAFLSTLLPAIGPAVAQLFVLSQTWYVPVLAFAVSVPTATEVDSVKFASDAFASPEPLSWAVHEMITSEACQTPSAEPQEMVGGVESSVIFATKASPVPVLEDWKGLTVGKSVEYVRPVT